MFNKNYRYMENNVNDSEEYWYAIDVTIDYLIEIDSYRITIINAPETTIEYILK